MIRFFIHHAIEPKQSNSARIVTTRDGRQFVNRYQPAYITKNAEALTFLMRMFAPPKPLDGPIHLTMTFFLPWRSSERKRDLDRGVMYADTKPDLDNLCKQVLDAMEPAGFFANDSRIADLTLRKVRTAIEVVDKTCDVQGVHVLLEPASEDELLRHMETQIWEPEPVE